MSGVDAGAHRITATDAVAAAHRIAAAPAIAAVAAHDLAAATAHEIAAAHGIAARAIAATHGNANNRSGPCGRRTPYPMKSPQPVGSPTAHKIAGDHIAGDPGIAAPHIGGSHEAAPRSKWLGVHRALDKGQKERVPATRLLSCCSAWLRRQAVVGPRVWQRGAAGDTCWTWFANSHRACGGNLLDVTR